MFDDDDNTGYDNTGYDNTGYDNTGYDNTGYDNTGYDNTGYDNTGYGNTGCHTGPVAGLVAGPVTGCEVDPGDFEGLVETGRKLAGADAALMGDDELVAMTLAVEQLRSLVETTCGHLLAELDSRGLCAQRYGLNTKWWVACAAGVSPTGVGLRIKTGRVSHDHLDAMDAVASTGPASMDSASRIDGHGYGRVGLSSDHVRVVASVLNARNEEGLAALQDEIVALAQGATFERFCAEVSGIASMLDADGPQPDDASVNTLSISRSMHGLTCMDATFSSDLGLVVSGAIDDKADELFRALVADNEVSGDLRVPDRRRLRALALVELVRIAVGTAPAARRAPRAEVTLVAHDHEVTGHDGQPMPRAALEVWGCDPELWAAVVDHMGVVTDMGHRRRLASVAEVVPGSVEVRW